MVTTPPFLVRASWGFSQIATGQVTEPVGAQSHALPYSLEGVFCIHVQELKTGLPFKC